MLILSRKPGDSLLINEEIEVKVIEVSGDKIKLGVAAPKNVKVLRKELRLIEESNKDSSVAANPAKLHSMLKKKPKKSTNSSKEDQGVQS